MYILVNYISGGKYSGEMKINECTHLIINKPRGMCNVSGALYYAPSPITTLLLQNYSLFPKIFYPAANDFVRYKRLFTPIKHGSEREKDQTTSRKALRINDKH